MTGFEGQSEAERREPVGQWPEKHTVKFDDVVFVYHGGAEIRQRLANVESRLGIPHMTIIHDAIGQSVDITPLLEAHLTELEQPDGQ
jgi:hypothetical protein